MIPNYWRRIQCDFEWQSTFHSTIFHSRNWSDVLLISQGFGERNSDPFIRKVENVQIFEQNCTHFSYLLKFEMKCTFRGMERRTDGEIPFSWPVTIFSPWRPFKNMYFPQFSQSEYTVFVQTIQNWKKIAPNWKKKIEIPSLVAEVHIQSAKSPYTHLSLSFVFIFIRNEHKKTVWFSSI